MPWDTQLPACQPCQGELETRVNQTLAFMHAEPPAGQENDTCQAGMARMSLQLGDIKQGRAIALSSDSPQLSKECAQILEARGNLQACPAGPLLQRPPPFGPCCCRPEARGGIPLSWPGSCFSCSCCCEAMCEQTCHSACCCSTNAVSVSLLHGLQLAALRHCVTDEVQQKPTARSSAEANGNCLVSRHIRYTACLPSNGQVVSLCHCSYRRAILYL